MTCKCEDCINSRPIVSENGISYKCILSSSQATKCLCGEQRFYKSCVADTEELIDKLNNIPCQSFLIDIDDETIQKLLESLESEEENTLSEAINKCNEQLETHPKFDFSDVKVIKE